MNQQDFNFQQEFSLEKEASFFKLPDQVPCDFQGKVGQVNIEEQLQKLPVDLQSLTQNNVIALSKYLKIWNLILDRGDYQDFIFNLPPSFFSGNCQIFTNRQPVFQEEFNQVQDLSSTQVQQIFQTGTFEIQSRQFQIPYVWQLSSFVIKGRKNITSSYFDDIGLAYHIFKHIPQFLYKEGDETGQPFTLRSGFYNLFCKLFVYLSIFVGFRETFSEVDINQIRYQIEHNRQLSLIQAQCFNQSLYQYFYYQDNPHNHEEYQIAQQKMNYLLKISQQFKEINEKIKLQMQNQYDTMIEQMGSKQRFEDLEEQREYLDNLKDQAMHQEKDFLDIYGIKVTIEDDLDTQIINAQINAQKQFFEKQLNGPDSIQLVNHINQLNECYRAYNLYLNNLSNELSSQQIEFQKGLLENNQIRSKSSLFINDEIKQFIKKQKAHFKEKFRILLFEDLKKQNIKDVDVYLNYLQNNKQMKEEVKKIILEEEKQNLRPNIVLQTTRRCFPPYKVIKIDNLFYLEREKTYSISSNYPFWKILFLMMRYFTWTVNVMYWLFANGISGPLGIKALFYCEVFHPDVEINSQTGHIYPSDFSVTPIVVHMSNVCKGMIKSRQDFENSPDTGFFGKNCARLFNIFEVYFFRFIIVGILGVLIILPILIILNFTLSIFLALTAWLWIVLVLILQYAFCILVYDYDVNERQNYNILSSSPFFPIIVNSYHFLIKGILSVLFNFIMIFLLIPLESIIVIIFGHLRYLLRSLYDCFTILLIKCLGRVPASENSLAWKISGPGITREYYFTIKNEEAIILIAGELEKCILQEYQKKLIELINAPAIQVQQNLQAFFAIYNATFNFSDQGTNQLQRNLRDQVQRRLALLPKLPSEVRFTGQEIDALKILTKQFLKNQIILKDMKNYIWAAYQTQKGDYNQLTAEILKKIFGSQILSPLEDLDLRFQLNANENYDFSQKIEKALEGQVNLNKPVNFLIQPTPMNQEKKIDKQFSYYQDIIEKIWRCQSIKQNWSSLNDKQKRFYVNYCLKNN